MPHPTRTPTDPSAELQKLFQEMEFVTKTFLSEAEKFVKSWYWQCAEFYATKFYDKTRELGPVKLGEMKAAVGRIDADASTLVNRLVGRAKFWTHRATDGQWSKVDFAKGAPKELLSAVASVTDEIKPILRRHGYLPASDKFDSNCPDPSAWPESLGTLADKYRALVREGLFLRSEIRAAEEDEKRQQARDLWRNA